MANVRNLFLIVFLSLILSLFGYSLYRLLWLRGGAGASLAVQSLYGSPLNVLLDNIAVGVTPIGNFKTTAGEKTLVLSDDRNTYQAKVTLGNGTLTVVNWGLGPNSNFSEGEVLWFEKSQNRGSAPLLVISDPDGAEVRLDDVLIGSTPLVNEDLAVGEHTLKISRENFKERTILINLQEGYKLNVKVKLFLLPFLGKDASRLESPGDPRFVLAGFSSDNPLLTADPISWAKGLTFYWNLGKEATISGSSYDYLLDFRGQLYDTAGVKIAASSEVESKLEKVKVAYLGKSGAGISEEAQKALADFAGKVFLAVRKVEVTSTPTGWLRVREKPSLAAKEIGRVNARDQLELVSESGDWYQIRMSNGTVGYISAAYARKL